MENKDRKNTQPEFTPDYIDQLFSGTNSEPQPPEPVVAPPPAAQEQPQPPRKKKPSKLKRKLRRHKKPLMYLAAAAVLILMVYLVIPNTIANAQSDRWQTRCEETYVELISRKAYHYTRKINSGSNAKNAEVWHHGHNELTISDWLSPGQKYIELFVNQIRYTKLIEADGSSFKWKHKADYSGVMDTTPKTLAEGKYILKSIRSSLSGTDVTFRHEKYGNQKLTFHFGAFGTFVGLTAESDIEGEPWIWVYTILPTAEDEILATILKYHEDATQ